MNFEFLFSFESCWCDLGTTQRWEFWENNFILGHSFEGNKCRYFVVKTYRFYFWYTIDLILLFSFHFNKTWNFVVFWLNFSINKRSIDFYNDFHNHIVVWILCSIKNIMKWFVIFFMDFLHCILNYIFWLYEISMNLVF